MNTNPSPRTRFNKGKSGNPSGRPKGLVSLAELLRRRLKTSPPGERKNYAEFLVGKLLSMALQGDIQAIKLIWNYTEGMPKSLIEIENKPTISEILDRIENETESNQST